MRRSALACVGCAPGRPSRDCSSDCSLRVPDTWAYLSVGAADQGLREPKAHERHRILATTDPNPTLNVLTSSAWSCATSRTTACPSGAPGLIHAKATAAGADSSSA